MTPMNSQSDRSTHWAQIEEKGVYTGFRFMVFVYQVCGKRILKLFLFFVIAYFFLTGRKARRASRTFLSHVWRTSAGKKALQQKPGLKASFKHFWSYGTAVLDKFAAWSGEFSLDQVGYTGRDIFERMITRGKGGVLVTAHLGNIEACRALGRLRRNLPINVLVHTRHAANFNRLLQKADPSSQVRLIQVSDMDLATSIMLQEKVAQGEFIVIAGDRIPLSSRHVNEVMFMGEPAFLPQGAFLLAAMLHCPVGLILCVKKQDQFHIILEDLGDMSEVTRKDRKSRIAQFTELFAARLEYYTVQYPYQWFNFFDFWARP